MAKIKKFLIFFCALIEVAYEFAKKVCLFAYAFIIIIKYFYCIILTIGNEGDTFVL